MTRRTRSSASNAEAGPSGIKKRAAPARSSRSSAGNGHEPCSRSSSATAEQALPPASAAERALPPASPAPAVEVPVLPPGLEPCPTEQVVPPPLQQSLTERVSHCFLRTMASQREEPQREMTAEQEADLRAFYDSLMRRLQADGLEQGWVGVKDQILEVRSHCTRDRRSTITTNRYVSQATHNNAAHSHTRARTDTDTHRHPLNSERRA